MRWVALYPGEILFCNSVRVLSAMRMVTSNISINSQTGVKRVT